MAVNEEVAILNISSETSEIYNKDTKSISTEIRYHYSLNGNDLGVKSVDGATRQEFLKLVFEISEDLSTPFRDKNEIKRKIRLLGESMYKLMLPERVCS